MIGQDQYRYGGVFMTNFKQNSGAASCTGKEGKHCFEAA